MSKTFWFSFGDLEIGSKFVYFNPNFHAKPNLDAEHYVKISPRRARDSWDRIFHVSVNTGVAPVRLEDSKPKLKESL